MATAQPGMFAQGTRSHRHLEFDLQPGIEPAALLDALASLRQPSVAAGGANIVIGFGASCWREIADPAIPIPVIPAMEGLVSTPHDVWVWVHGSGDDVLFDVTRAVHAMLASVAVLASEVPGFVYRDGRDLTGFIDGTENPPIEAAHRVVTRAFDPGAGGSFALVQRWVHDLDAFHELEIVEQEDVIGRTKVDSVELSDDRKPPTAHIARVVIEDDGEELEIYRRSVPYGSLTEKGLLFVAFSADPTRFDRMLRRMFGATADGLHDRLTDFSRPVSGAYYFVPSLEQLGDALG